MDGAPGTVESMSKPKTSPACKFILGHLLSIYPCGKASTNAMPVTPDGVPQPSMVHVSALLRRGWLHEPCRGVYYLTDAGVKAAVELCPEEYPYFPGFAPSPDGKAHIVDGVTQRTLCGQPEARGAKVKHGPKIEVSKMGLWMARCHLPVCQDCRDKWFLEW